MGHHLELHGGALDVGLAQGGRLAVVYQQHVVDGQGAVHLQGDPVEVVVAVGLEPELLT